MADRTVSVRLQAVVSSYLASMSAAGKATTDLANKVDKAKGRSKAGFTALGREAMIGGGAVVAGLVLATKAMADFDAKMSLVQTLSHATAADMRDLRDAAMHTGQGIGYTASQVADAEAELVKAGVGVKDILGGALHGALTLAAAGQTDVASATETAAIAMTQFKLSGADVPHIADLLAAGADKALGSVADLSEGLQSGGLSAAQMGLSVDDTIATLAEFAQGGLLAEKGGTVLRQMFIKLSAPSKQAGDELKTLGINVFDANGQFVGMSKLAGQLHDKLTPLTQAERNHALAVIFGARAIQGANILVKDGATGWDKWSKAVNDAGFAQQQASGKLNNLHGDISKLVAALDNDLINAGSHANGSLRALTQGTTGLLHGFADLPGPVQTAAVAILGVGGAITLVGGATLLMIPKVQAGRLALDEMGVAGVRVNTALGLLGKASLVGGVLFGVAAGIRAIDNALNPGPNVDKLTNSLVNLQETGKALGELRKTFGSDLSGLSKDVKRITDPSNFVRAGDVAGTIVHIGGLLGSAHPNLDLAHKDISALDQSLASLVTGGHADVAKSVLANLAAAAATQGVSMKQLTGLLPKYALSLDDVSTQSKLAAGNVKGTGSALEATAAKAAAAEKVITDAVTAARSAVSSAFASDTSIITLFDPAKASGAVDAATKKLAAAQQRLGDLSARPGGKHGRTVAAEQSLAHARQAVATATENVAKAQKAAGTSTLAATYDKEIVGARSFLTNINTVLARGLDPHEVEQLLEAGPTAAAPVLQQLVGANSQRLIKMSNDAEATVRRINSRLLELTRLNTIALASSSDALVRELPSAAKIVTALHQIPKGASGDWLEKHLGMTPADIKGIAADFGITLPKYVQRALDANPVHLRVAGGFAAYAGDTPHAYRPASSGTTIVHQTTTVDRSTPVHIDKVVAANYNDFQRQLARKTRIGRAVA
jgi:TP901 family phage tail tape measure protein